MGAQAITPIFVVGSPRSGTTMVGSWLASDPETYDVGEYNAFFLTRRLIPGLMRGVQPASWAPHLERYLAEVADHAVAFIDDVARRVRCNAYVDSSPRNIMIADELAERLPDARFVLLLRHYSGVVQSLGRTDWSWVPSSAAGRGDVWVEAYEQIERLPADRTIPISYDALCARPEATLADACARLHEAGARVDRLDPRQLGYSHAHVLGQPRPTLATEDGTLAPVASVDMREWTPVIHAAVWPRVSLVDARLRDSFAQYEEPRDWITPNPVATAEPATVARATGAGPVLASAEFVVHDVARALEFLVDLLGLEVVQRRPHPDFDAETIVLSAGTVTLSLLHPTDAGDRPPFPLLTPRLSHLTFAIEDEQEFVALRSRLVEAGAAVAHGGPGMFHLPDAFTSSVLGAAPAIVVVHLAADAP